MNNEKFVKIKDHTYLRKDMNTNAILNVNNTSYAAAKKRLKQAKRIDKLETQLAAIMDHLNLKEV